MPVQPRPEVLRHTAAVVSAHLGHNRVDAKALPQLIQSVYQALMGLGTAEVAEEPAPTPAVPIRKSVFPDYLVCLEDGAKMKMLKRYIQKRYDLTPAAYRERWNLPPDYPMVAPNYTEKRSALARRFGLGRKPAAETPAEQAPEPEPEMAPAPAQAPAPAPKPRSRRKS